MATTEEHLATLNVNMSSLLRAVLDGGSSMTGSGGSTRNSRSYNLISRDDPNKRADRFYADNANTFRKLLKVTNMSSTFLDQIAKNSTKSLANELLQITSNKRLDKLPAQVQKLLEKQSNKAGDPTLFKSLISSNETITTFADVLKASERTEEILKLSSALAEYSEKLEEETLRRSVGPMSTTLADDMESNTEHLMEVAESIGITGAQLNSLGLGILNTVGGVLDTTAIERANAVLEDNIVAGQNFNNTLRDIVTAGNNLSSTFDSIKKGLPAVIFAAVAKSIGTIDDSARAAAKFGSTIQWSTDALYGVGLTAKELIETQAEHRQSVMALDRGFEGHTEMLLKDQDALYDHIGSVSGASKANASFLDLAQTISGTVDQSKIEGLMDTQSKTFMNLNNTLGMTSEQFIDLSSSLFDNADAMSHFFLTDGQDRQKYMTSLYSQYKTLTTTMGLTAESAKRAQSALQGLAGEDAEERLAKGAKLAAFAGSIGMGDKSQLLQNAVTSGNLNSPEILKVFAQMNKTLSAQVSGNFGAELQFDKMISKFGIGEYVGKKSVLAGVTNSEGKQFDTQTSQNQEIIDGLPRSGSETMEYWWHNGSMFWDKTNVSLSMIGANSLIISGLLLTITKQLAVIGYRMVVSGAIGSVGTAASTVGTAGTAVTSIGSKIVPILSGLAKGFLAVDGAIAVLIAGSESISEWSVTGDWKDSLDVGLEKFADSFLLGLTSDVEFMHSNTKSKALANIGKDDGVQIVQNYVDEQLNEMAGEGKLNGKLADPNDVKIGMLSDDRIEKMSATEKKETSEKYDRIADAIKEGGDTDKKTQFLLEEIAAIQKQLVKVGENSIDEQKNTTDAVKKTKDTYRDQMENYKGKVLRGEFLKTDKYSVRVDRRL